MTTLKPHTPVYVYGSPYFGEVGLFLGFSPAMPFIARVEFRGVETTVHKSQIAPTEGWVDVVEAQAEALTTFVGGRYYSVDEILQHEREKPVESEDQFAGFGCK